MSLKITEGPYAGPKSGGGGKPGGGTNMVEYAIQMIRDLINTVINISNKTIKVSLPENVFNPDGSETVDFMRLQINGANAEEIVWEYTAKELETIRFTHYGIFNNRVKGAEVRFFPTIDGARILKRHGDPMDNLALYLSVGIDLSENSMIPCDVTLTPGQTIRWTAKNVSAVEGEFGVRMRGYIVKANKLNKSGG